MHYSKNIWKEDIKKMRPSTLREKLLEFHAKREEQSDDTNSDSLLRCVTNYFQRRFDNKKVQKIIEDMYERYDLLNDSINIKRKIQLSNYIDSIVLSRIRDSYKTSKDLDIDTLDQLKFKSLVKQILLSFGYEILFIPTNNKYLDLIIHRKDIKIAVLAIKNELDSLVGIKTIRQLRYVANCYNCDQAILFTNANLCYKELNEAGNIDITVLDRNKIIPLVKDLIDGYQREDGAYMISEPDQDKYAIFLEGEIKFPKTKVQVVSIKYYIDKDNSCLIFEGRLINTGKRPASDIKIEIKLFNRNSDCIYANIFPVEKETLESSEETVFKCSFNEVPQHDRENLCRYQLRLDYKNTYKVLF